MDLLFCFSMLLFFILCIRWWLSISFYKAVLIAVILFVITPLLVIAGLFEMVFTTKQNGNDTGRY